MMQMSNNGHTRSNFSASPPSHYEDNVNTHIGGNRVIHGGLTSVTLAECPFKCSCEPGCDCANCTKDEHKVWTQNIIPIAANIRTTTRQQADMIRGDINITSCQAPIGWFHSAAANRKIEKGARDVVFGVSG